MRRANPAITLEQAAAFRSAYFTPDNATLVISGDFDADLANRWIDYLFADWQGHAAGHNYVPASPHAELIAKADDTTLVQMRLAIPIAPGARAQHLVVAEMLGDIAHDVRYRLGATYTFDGRLAETREASYLVLGGWIDAAQTTAAVELVRDRIGELQRDPAAAATTCLACGALRAWRRRAPSPCRAPGRRAP
ncbi:MAG TPA: insulinase family protein [Kofleriaceae bacterium]|nr:insulinase family protein [Kofleriaceae bacterium]